MSNLSNSKWLIPHANQYLDCMPTCSIYYDTLLVAGTKR